MKQPESEATLAANKTQSVVVRMDPDLHDDVKELAEKYDLSVAQVIRTALKVWIEEPRLAG